MNALSLATPPELLASFCFVLALLHTFSASWFHSRGNRYEAGSLGENFFHLLGEVEVVFGLWAGVYLAGLTLLATPAQAIAEVESRNFTEAAFVFVILVMCSTQPLLVLAEKSLMTASRMLPLSRSAAFYWTCLVLGPLLGSLITEPAAMTVSALLLSKTVFRDDSSRAFRYATLGLLFVNVSIGGTLTAYAAPPVLMVAKLWGWDSGFMLHHFGWKALLAIVISTSLTTAWFQKELKEIALKNPAPQQIQPSPFWVTGIHLLFVAGVVLTAHHLAIFLGLFLFFLGFIQVTQEYQSELKLREGLLVGFFLGGLVLLGGPQRWWLEPLLAGLDDFSLYLGSIFLTAITDNAALTYLGAQVPDLSAGSRYALVAGAVTGGGLTLLANAPNLAGYGILKRHFGDSGVQATALLMSALGPTLIAALIFWWL